MFKRIGFNFRHNLRWMLERFVLFLLLLSFFAAALLMNDLAGTVSEKYLKDVGLYLTVQSKDLTVRSWDRDLQWGYGSWEPGGDYDRRVEALAENYKQLCRLPGVKWSDLSYDTGNNFPVWLKEPGPAGSVLELTGSQDYDAEAEWLTAEWTSVRKQYSRYGHPQPSYGNPGGGFMTTDGKSAFELSKEVSDRLLQFEDKESDLGWRISAGQTDILRGVSGPIPREFRLGTRKIMEGRLFTREEIDEGAAVCVIPRNLAFIERGYPKDGWHLYRVGTTLNLAIPLLDENGNLVDELDLPLEIIGTYPAISYSRYEELNSCPNCIYMPEQTMFRIRDAAWQYYQDNGRQYFRFSSLSRIYGPNVLMFQFDTISHMESFVERLEQTPEYKNGDYSYYAELGKVIGMISGFYSAAASFRSVVWVFAALALGMALMLTVLDAFYRRREIAVLQSMGEKPRRITLQLMLELLAVLLASAATALPLAVLAVRRAIPALLSRTGQALEDGAAEAAQSGGLDAGLLGRAVQIGRAEWLGVGLLILAALVICCAAVAFFTRHFSVRKLLND